MDQSRSEGIPAGRNVGDYRIGLKRVSQANSDGNPTEARGESSDWGL